MKLKHEFFYVLISAILKWFACSALSVFNLWLCLSRYRPVNHHRYLNVTHKKVLERHRTLYSALERLYEAVGRLGLKGRYGTL